MSFSVALVNDSPMAREILRRALESSPRFKLSWTANNGREAVEACAQSVPDLILMDLMMPVMDGVEATRRIMAATPCPILIVTGSVGTNSAEVFEAMGAGAIDVIRTPNLGDDAGRAAFLAKLETMTWLMHPAAKGSPPAASDASKHAASSAASKPDPCSRLVIIGSSAGGPAALSIVLRALPKYLAAGVVIIQHIDEQFASSLANWLQAYCSLPVRTAVAGEKPIDGTVLVAASEDHLVLRTGGRFAYTPEPVGMAYRPSVDVFMSSAVKCWDKEMLGVILTGMGRDGAKGLKEIRQKGFPTIAQDRATSAVYGMPKAAAEMGAAEEILPLTEIGPRIVSFVNGACV